MISFIGAVYESSKEIPEHRNTELHFWLSTTHALNQQIVVILSTRLVALKDSVKSIRCPKQAEATFLVLAAQCNLKPSPNSNLNNNFFVRSEDGAIERGATLRRKTEGGRPQAEELE